MSEIFEFGNFSMTKHRIEKLGKAHQRIILRRSYYEVLSNLVKGLWRNGRQEDGQTQRRLNANPLGSIKMHQRAINGNSQKNSFNHHQNKMCTSVIGGGYFN